MNVYELEKMAGEWREIESRGFHALWPKAWPKAKRTSEYTDKCKIATFDYDNHCRNNFLKALEALKEEHKVSVGYEGDMLNASPHCPEICDVCNLIKELEEVET